MTFSQAFLLNRLFLHFPTIYTGGLNTSTDTYPIDMWVLILSCLALTRVHTGSKEAFLVTRLEFLHSLYMNLNNSWLLYPWPIVYILYEIFKYSMVMLRYLGSRNPLGMSPNSLYIPSMFTHGELLADWIFHLWNRILLTKVPCSLTSRDSASIIVASLKIFLKHDYIMNEFDFQLNSITVIVCLFLRMERSPFFSWVKWYAYQGNT